MKIQGVLKTNGLIIDGKPIDINESLKLRKHSPAGFAWGYYGSGPAQTALAILLIATSTKEAVNFYQEFKHEVVSGWRGDFTIEYDVVAWLNSKRNGK